MSPKTPKLNLKSCTLIVKRYMPSADMIVHLHNLFAARVGIDYNFIQVIIETSNNIISKCKLFSFQWVNYGSVPIQNFLTFDVTLSQDDGRKPEVHVMLLQFHQNPIGFPQPYKKWAEQ